MEPSDLFQIGGANSLFESYVDNGNDKPIEADIRESVIRRGVVTMNSTVDDATEMVEAVLAGGSDVRVK